MFDSFRARLLLCGYCEQRRAQDALFLLRVEGNPVGSCATGAKNVAKHSISYMVRP
jgi:hypothetical protein